MLHWHSWRYLHFVGYRLNVTILKTKAVSDWLACVLECVTEPCCRSINYKKSSISQNESNCEMLHNMVYNTSQKLLEPNCSYDHVFLNNPQKVKIIHNILYLERVRFVRITKLARISHSPTNKLWKLSGACGKLVMWFINIFAFSPTHFS